MSNTLSKTKKDNKETKILSQIFLRPEVRFKHQTTEFLYKALDIAEDQIQELLDEVEALKNNQDGKRD